MRYLIAAAVLTLLAGCATTKKYEENLQGWLGKPEQELVRAWGAPNSFYETGGIKFLTYAKTRQGFIPGAAPSYQTQVIGNTVVSTPMGGYPGRSITSQCSRHSGHTAHHSSGHTSKHSGHTTHHSSGHTDTTFEVSAGVVSSYRFEGNDCKAK